MDEVLAHWLPQDTNDGLAVDGTVGGGGHAAALLDRFPRVRLLGLDRDPDALSAAGNALARFTGRVRLVQADLGDLEAVLADEGHPEVAGILFDLGVSSHQIDDPTRGFSHSATGPLRMTLDRDAATGAEEYLRDVEEGDLRRIFREWGELPAAGRAARAVLRARDEGKLRTTAELAEALRRGGAGSPRRLSQAFQAIRLAVNDELRSLDRGLAAAEQALPPGGHLTVISFESLMDRVVKNRFRPPRSARPHPGIPDPPAQWTPLTRRVVRPTQAEIENNPRSRSARLRAAKRRVHD